jgi:hypothetical protein
MFKKIKNIYTVVLTTKMNISNYYTEIKEYFSNIKERLANMEDKVYWVSEHNSSKETYIRTMESKQRTIEALANALCNKYDKGLFIFSEDGKIPTVIRNGKVLTDDLTQSFSINWSPGEFPNIEIEQIAGTHHDMDM